MYHVAALYKFTNLSDPEQLKADLLPKMKDLGISGTLIFADEGINGTVAGSEKALSWLTEELFARTGIKPEDIKWSTASEQPFKRTKIKIKPEIVTLREDGVDAASNTGEFVSPDDWNKLLEDPETIVIDTRNFYETEIGTFKGAVDPKTESFTDFPDYVQKTLDPEKDEKVAMFCTGGIRCEKASAYMKKLGFKNVYQLHGGILKYLETMPPEQSLWEGECFVFDDRVAVRHGLEEGTSTMCYGCGFPLTVEDQNDPHYEDGVCCARCYNDHSEERKKVLRERHQRIREAKAQG